MAKQTIKALQDQIDKLTEYQKVAAMVVPSEEARGSASTRRNAASTGENPNKFANIENGLSPITRSSRGGLSSESIAQAVDLCQKAYWNFNVVRHTIEMMVEFSTNEIYYKDGNAKSRQFFQALFNKIGIWNLQEQFFREYYRSGNIFLYRLDGKLDPSDVTKITQVYGTEVKAKTIELPIKYLMLDPACINYCGGATFAKENYKRVLNSSQLTALKSPKTEEDKEFIKSLNRETRDKISNNSDVEDLYIDLDPKRIYLVFYKKQDYENFGVPMAWGVLADLNWKEELKKMDMAVARTMQQAILLVTCGESAKDGGMGVSRAQMQALHDALMSRSVGQVLVSDYTTKAEYVIPQIGDIIDPKKYEVVDRDIMMGLHNILAGSDKFANQSIKINVFMEKLKQARQAFINDFLMPEVKRIAQLMGFKNYPTPYFQDFSLKDELEYVKIYTRLMELGILTADEGLKAIETGILPDPESSRLSQKEFRKLHEEKQYIPIVNYKLDEELKAMKAPPVGGAPKTSIKQSGRPSGTKAPQTTKKIRPMGAQEEASDVEVYSLKDIKATFSKISDLNLEIQKVVLKKYKIKKLSEAQTGLVDTLAELIIVNEEPENWAKSIEKYIENPVDQNHERVAEIRDLAAEHNLSYYSAALLYNS